MRSLKDTVVAVTGASSGIGAATARTLVEAGARVVLGARHRDRLDTLVTDLGAAATPVEMDVRSPEGPQRLVAAALEVYGRIDSLVANAGIGAYGGILDHSDEVLHDIMDTNLAGTVWTVRAALPSMLAAGAGDIVIVSSVAGLRGGADEAVYAATKFAQVGLAGSLDRELREQGIRVSTICPAGVETEFAMGLGRTKDMPGLHDMLAADDVAAAIRCVLEQPRTMRTQLWSMWSMSQGS
jgi:NADP-dependent 3-hydroxy acid dehydrogenase YdfG